MDPTADTDNEARPGNMCIVSRPRLRTRPYPHHFGVRYGIFFGTVRLPGRRRIEDQSGVTARTWS